MSVFHLMALSPFKVHQGIMGNENVFRHEKFQL